MSDHELSEGANTQPIDHRPFRDSSPPRSPVIPPRDQLLPDLSNDEEEEEEEITSNELFITMNN